MKMKKCDYETPEVEEWMLSESGIVMTSETGAGGGNQGGGGDVDDEG